MISKGPGAQYRRGHSFGCVHKRADVSSWMRSRNHMLDLSLTGFDPTRTLTGKFPEENMASPADSLK
jgi:hypothetical protein